MSLPPKQEPFYKNPEAGNGRAGKPTFAIRLESSGTIPSDSDLTINGGGNFNIRNTNGWVYNGAITGNDTGSINININTGTDAELAGDISGVLNIIEYVLGSNAKNDPNVTSPSGTVVGLNLVFTFTRTDMSEIDTTQSVEWSSDMVVWNDIPIGAASAGAVQVEERGADPDLVTVTIPTANAQDGRLFTRLKVLKH